MRSIRFAAALLCVALGSCAVETDNAPINVPFTGVTPTDPHNMPAPKSFVVGVAFSGGGTRAAAFAFGVLKGLAAMKMTSGDSALAHASSVAYRAVRSPRHISVIAAPMRWAIFANASSHRTWKRICTPARSIPRTGFDGWKAAA